MSDQPFDQAVAIPAVTAEELARSQTEMAKLLAEAEALNAHLAERQGQGFRLRWIGPQDTVVKAGYLKTLEDYVQRYLRVLDAEAATAPVPAIEITEPVVIPPEHLGSGPE